MMKGEKKMSTLRLVGGVFSPVISLAVMMFLGFVLALPIGEGAMTPVYIAVVVFSFVSLMKSEWFSSFMNRYCVDAGIGLGFSAVGFILAFFFKAYAMAFLGL